MTAPAIPQSGPERSAYFAQKREENASLPRFARWEQQTDAARLLEFYDLVLYGFDCKAPGEPSGAARTPHEAAVIDAAREEIHAKHQELMRSIAQLEREIGIRDALIYRLKRPRQHGAVR